MDEMKAEAIKFNLDLKAYFKAVSTRFQAASAIIIATMSIQAIQNCGVFLND
jgi:hypothetical protein